MERITYEQTRQAVEMAARLSKLPLTLQSHGIMGRGQGYSITNGEGGSRIGAIGTKAEIYALAHALTDFMWALQNAAGRKADLAHIVEA